MIPKALRVVAWIHLLGGLLSLAGVVSQLTHDRFLLDFGILGIPIYFGLMERSNGWRTCAIVILQIDLLLVPCVFVLGLVSHAPARFQVSGVELARVSPLWLAVLAVPIFVLAWWQYRVLQRPEIEALFRKPRGEPAG
jgi:hypothetical protein